MTTTSAIEDSFFSYSEQARQAGDDAGMHAFDKAAAQWAKGVLPIRSARARREKQRAAAVVEEDLPF